MRCFAIPRKTQNLVNLSYMITPSCLQCYPMLCCLLQQHFWWFLEVIYQVGQPAIMWLCVLRPWLTFWKSFCCLALSVMCLQAATHCWTSAEALAKLASIFCSVPSSRPFSGDQRWKCGKYLTPAGMKNEVCVQVDFSWGLEFFMLIKSWAMFLIKGLNALIDSSIL